MFSWGIGGITNPSSFVYVSADPVPDLHPEYPSFFLIHLGLCLSSWRSLGVFLVSGLTPLQLLCRWAEGVLRTRRRQREGKLSRARVVKREGLFASPGIESRAHFALPVERASSVSHTHAQKDTGGVFLFWHYGDSRLYLEFDDLPYTREGMEGSYTSVFKSARRRTRWEKEGGCHGW